MKKTIEEVAEEYASTVHDKDSERLSTAPEHIDWENRKFNFLEGAKYQSEQMYSEEEMNEYAKWIYEDDGSLIDNNGHPKKESLQLWKKWKESKS